MRSVGKSVTEELLALYDYAHWRQFDRLAGLTDAEYLWEPVPGCWSVRSGDDGVVRAQWVRPEPVPAPLTTIAWRMWHIGSGCFDGYCTHFFGDRAQEDREQWPGSADEAIARLDREWARFRVHVAALDAEALAAPLGPKGGEYAQDSHHALVLHALDEVIHHGAEIGVLRDLYRASGGGTFGGADR